MDAAHVAKVEELVVWLEQVRDCFIREMKQEPLRTPRRTQLLATIGRLQNTMHSVAAKADKNMLDLMIEHARQTAVEYDKSGELALPYNFTGQEDYRPTLPRKAFL